MAKVIKILTAVSVSVFLVFLALYSIWQIGVLLTLCITFGTVAYHFAMRLLVGGIVNAVFHNKMDPDGRWFRERRFEKRLYAFLRVKKWKKYIPTYAPETFSAQDRSLEELAQATCQAEAVHEIIIIFSFLPLLLIPVFGEPAAFITTSFLAALLDSVFVILQRYNRPRLLKLIKNRRRPNKSV